MIGPDRKLVIDANTGWDADTAIYCIKTLADCNLAVVEQPTPDGDYAALARVRRETGAVVMADDMCFNLVHAQELIRNEACDLISVYPGKNGGIRKSQRDRGICRTPRRRLHDRLESGIRHWHGRDGAFDRRDAKLQVEEYPGDIHGPAYFESRVVRQPLKIEGPITHLSDRPGLGVEVEWSTLRSSE